MTESAENVSSVGDQSAVAGLIERLQAKVAERQASGEYPDGLADKLDEHFRRIVFHRTDHDVNHLFDQLANLDASAAFDSATIETTSSMPGGKQLHSAIAKAVSRQTRGILQQNQRFADDVRNIIGSLVLAVQDGSSHVHADLISRIDGILERLDGYERTPVDSAAGLGDLRRRVEELEQREASRSFKPWFTNDSFEDAFRGSEAELRNRYLDLADVFNGAPGPVVDLGCGRGEFLELLRERGTQCWGIEIDPDLADIARKAELRVEVGDGIAILANLDDESLGGISLVQVVEHLSQQQQLDLVATAFAKLRHGGKLVIETVNPQSLYVYAHAFYIDPTHTRPVHPMYLHFLQTQIGFSEVGIDWRNDPPAEDRLEHEPDGDSLTNRNVDRLNNLLFAASDYATIAIK